RVRRGPDPRSATSNPPLRRARALRRDARPRTGRSLAPLAQAAAQRRHGRRAVAPDEPDEERRGIVRVARLPQVEVLVRAVHQPVRPGPDVRDVELLAVEERGVAIRVADGRALGHLARLRVELRAVAEEARRSVLHADRGAVVVGDAEAALVVAYDEP